ncbi:MAG: BCCT family transporter, partial [Proteobacteria bacterium]|nr:BCCT family transporter [Pseudomonadota bacterium]
AGLEGILQNNGSVEVRWSGRGPVGTLYEVYRKLATETTFTFLGNVDASTKKFNDAGVPAGTISAAYQVRAIRADLVSPYSTQFSILFGTATTLGLGVSQMNAGLNYLFEIDISTTTKVTLIAVISVIGTLSAISGVDKGIKFLSIWNIRISLILLLFFLLAGPTVFLLGMFITSIGDYVWNLVPMGSWVDLKPESRWQGDWTLFYWGWWLAWGPLVGLFIARISRGRTIRQFLLSALTIPPLGGFLWMVIFGGTALHIELYGVGGIVDAVNHDMTMALYQTIEALGVESLSWPMAALATFMIVTWFVTSADSGTLVICTILSMGNRNPPRRFRIIWGLGLGAVAASLLLAGGLTALQTLTIAVALPFSVVLLFMCVALIKGLNDEANGVVYNVSNQPAQET